jgi:hypothetical protein
LLLALLTVVLFIDPTHFWRLAGLDGATLARPWATLTLFSLQCYALAGLLAVNLRALAPAPAGVGASAESAVRLASDRRAA